MIESSNCRPPSERRRPTILIAMSNRHKEIISERRKSRDQHNNYYLNYCQANCCCCYCCGDDGDGGKDGCGGDKKCQVKINSLKLPLLVLINIALVLLANIELSRATSQINSIWVSRDDHSNQKVISDRLGLIQNLTLERVANRPKIKRLNSTSAIKKLKSPMVKTNVEDTFRELKQQLKTAASSLQPAIVAAETPDEEIRREVVIERNRRPFRQQAQRRSEQVAALERPSRFKLAHINTNFTDEATSLDHLWSGNSSNSSAGSNQTLSNEQVQFDEEQHQQAGGHQSRRLAHEGHSGSHREGQPTNHRLNSDNNHLNLSSMAVFDRRQDNQTRRSQLAPILHEDYQPIYVDELHERRPTKNNSQVDSNQASLFVDDLADSLLINSSAPLKDPNYTNHSDFSKPHTEPDKSNSRQPAPGVYYLPNGDKWNTITFDNKLFEDSAVDENEQVGDGREHRSSSYSSIDQNVAPNWTWQAPVDHSNQALVKTKRFNNNRDDQSKGSSFEAENSLLDLNDFDEEQIKRAPGVPTTGTTSMLFPTTPADFIKMRPPSTHGFMRNTPQTHSTQTASTYGLYLPLDKTTSRPILRPSFYTPPPPPPPINSAHPQSVYMTSTAPYFRPRPIDPFTLNLAPLSSPMRQAIANSQIKWRANQPKSNRARSQTINLGDTASTQSPISTLTTRSFLRNYSPMQLLTSNQSYNNKNKSKSLLSTLNDKLNNWTSGESSSPNVAKYLESSFYDTPSVRPPRPAHRRPNSNGLVSPLTHLRQAPYLRPPPPQMFYSSAVQQPTVAPASSLLLNRFYHNQAATRLKANRGSGRDFEQLGSKQAASFIPVVAVQVTRTSPAPIAPSGQLHRQPNDLSPSTSGTRPNEVRLFGSVEQNQFNQQASANEIDEYLASKTSQLGGSAGGAHRHLDGGVSSNLNLNERQKWDDTVGGYLVGGGTGSSSSSSAHKSAPDRLSNRYNYNAHTLQQSALQPGHETTVKSAAVFGYLPHQADTPLLQAINLFNQQMPASAQTGANRHQVMGTDQHEMDYTSGGVAINNELYANQMDRSNQAVDAATPLVNQHSFAHLPAAGWSFAEDTPSLAFQLQANNYAQNDIAHPFGTLLSQQQPRTILGAQSTKFSPAASDSALSSHQHLQLIKPLDVYSSDQLNGYQPQLDFLAPSLSNLANQAYQDQLAQLIINPLLGANTASLSDEQRQSAANSIQQQSLTASGSQQLLNQAINPALFGPAALFYQSSSPSLESPFYDILKLSSSQGDSTGQQQDSSPAASQQQPEPSEGADSNSSEAQRGGQSTSTQNKGKKRSSDFFASASQLLLSALPLLLAPTLGLMFASSPNSIARYHGANPLGPASGANPSIVSPGHFSPPDTSSYLNNGINEGLVTNASPLPQLFTPTPPKSSQNYQNSIVDSELDDYSTTMKHLKPLGVNLTAVSFSPASSPSTEAPKRLTGRHKANNITASLPALTGLKLATTTSRAPKISSSKLSTTARPTLTLIVTTLAPTNNFSFGAPLSNVASKNGSTDFTQLIDLNSSTTTLEDFDLKRSRNGTTNSPTLLVFETNSGNNNDEYELSSSSSSGNEQPEGNSSVSYSGGVSNANRTYQLLFDNDTNNKFVNSFLNVSTTKSPPILYDIGYEGADFDAQFATLKRVATKQQQIENQKQRPYVELTTLGPSKYVKDKTRYQYVEVGEQQPAADLMDTSGAASNQNVSWLTRPTSDQNGTNFKPNKVATVAPESESELRLYPVATWPPMRRRTVSLITSTGNKTLPDSSERYTLRGALDRRQANNSRRATFNRSKDQVASGQQQINSTTSRQVAPTSRQNDATSNFAMSRSTSTQVEVNSLSPEANNLPFQLDKRRSSSGVQSLTLDSFIVDTPHDSKRQEYRTNSAPSPLVRRRRHTNELQPVEMLSTTTNKPTLKGRVKLVKRRLREHRKVFSEAEVVRPELQLERPTSNSLNRDKMELNSIEQLYDQQNETMRRDASKSKSAIVTAMITHVANDGRASGNDEDDRDYDRAPERGNSRGRLDEDFDGRTTTRNSSLRRLISSRQPPGVVEDDVEEAELMREQLLAKKMLLDRLATRASASSSNDNASSYQLESNSLAAGDSIELSSGGRGRLRPIPVQTERENYSTTRFVQNSSPRVSTKPGRNSMKLNEATKRALADFGSLLLEDTLSLLDNKGTRPHARARGPSNRSRYALANQDHEFETSSATERYAMRATQAPPMNYPDGGQHPAEAWSRFYAENSTGHSNDYPHANLSASSQVYRNPARLARGQSQSHELGPSFEPLGEHNYSAAAQLSRQQRQHLSTDNVERFGPSGATRTGNGHAYEADSTLPPLALDHTPPMRFRTAPMASGESPTLSHYNDFLVHNFQPNRTNSSLASEHPATQNLTSSEQLEARFSTYANYSTTAPAYSPPGPLGAYYSDRYAPADARGNHHYSGPTRHETDAYGRGSARPGEYANHYNNHHNQPHYTNHSSFGLLEPTYEPRHSHGPQAGSSYQQHRLQPSVDTLYPPSPASNYYTPVASQSRLPPDDRYQPQSQWTGGTGGGVHLDSPPTTRYPASYLSQSSGAPLALGYGHEHAHQHLHPHPHHHHTPSSSTYAPAPSISFPTNYNGPHDQHSMGFGSQAPSGASYGLSGNAYDSTNPKAGDTKAVNEYLKRVQFSDSDRDKLMASYLTCDGLLNDNDHCLERLSCEFSDPQNIEKANKLDRAVSSILLGHILINTYIPNSFKLRLKSASLFGYTQSGKCSKFACSKLARATNQID